MSGVSAADSAGEPGRSSGKANPLKNVYFGEQHLHTSNSPDAFAAGSRQSWDDTFRYGRGEEVTLHTITTNNKIKRGTPYDFMAITDHAEYFGVMPRMIDTNDPLSKGDPGFLNSSKRGHQAIHGPVTGDTANGVRRGTRQGERCVPMQTMQAG